MISKNLPFKELKRSILEEVKIIEEIMKSSGKIEDGDKREEKIVMRHILLLKNSLKKENNNLLNLLDKISFPKDLPKTKTAKYYGVAKKEDNLPKKTEKGKNDSFETKCILLTLIKEHN